MIFSVRYFFLFFFITSFLSGCGSLGGVTDQLETIAGKVGLGRDSDDDKQPSLPKKEPKREIENTVQNQSSESFQLPRNLDLAGSWVFYGNCGRQRGAFDLKSSGRSYKGKTLDGLYEIKISPNTKSNRLNLSFVSAQYKNQIEIGATLSNNQLLIDGLYSEKSTNAQCSSFIAAKYEKNNDRNKKPRLNLSSSGKGSFSALGNLISKMKSSAPSKKQCLSYFNLVAQSDAAFILNKRMSPVFLNTPKSVEYIGVSYDNWTQQKAQAYLNMDRQCVNMIHRIPELKNLYPKYRKNIALFDFLKNGKSKNPYASGKWAKNFFFVAAYRAAKTQQEMIISDLRSYPPTKETLDKINTYTLNNGRKTRGAAATFPINALSVAERTLLSQQADEVYQEKYAVYLENEKSKAYAVLEDKLRSFSASNYPMTLEGLKTAKVEINRVAQTNQYYDQDSKAQTLVKNYIKQLEKHSEVVAQNAIKEMPEYAANLQSMDQFKRYRADLNDNLLPELLRVEHKVLINKTLDNKWQSLVDQLAQTIETDLAFESDDLDKNMRQLDSYSSVIFDQNIENIGGNFTDPSKQFVAQVLSQESNNLRNTCDLEAAHSGDIKKPYFIQGQTDKALSASLETALDACITSIEQDPNNPRYNFQLGRVLYLSGLYDEADTYLNEAVTLGYKQANHYLAVMQLEQGEESEDSFNKAIALFEIAAEEKFQPSIDFISDYRKDLFSQKEADSRVANMKYKYRNTMESFLEREDYKTNLQYDSIMYLTALMMKQLHEFCPDLVTQEEVQNILSKLSDDRGYRLMPNAEGYIKYINRNLARDQRKNGLMRPTAFRHKYYKDQHPLDKTNADLNGFNAQNDIFKLVATYQCFGLETEKFVKNVKDFFDTAPPFNLTSQAYWQACENSNIQGLNVPKQQFCGCFLGYIREKLPISHSFAHKLLMNFSGEASKALNDKEAKDNGKFITACAYSTEGWWYNNLVYTQKKYP